MKKAKDTKERTALGEAILRHWREHCPRMVRDLERENRLEQAVFEAQTRAGDLLYELVSVRKMDYQAAWEMAREEWALPESGEGTESGLPQPEKSKPAKSKPGKSTPQNSKSPTSRRRRRGRRRATSG